MIGGLYECPAVFEVWEQLKVATGWAVRPDAAGDRGKRHPCGPHAKGASKDAGAPGLFGLDKRASSC